MTTTRRALRIAARGGMILALAAATAACSGGHSSSSSGTTTTTPSTPSALCDAFLEQFGFGFCQRYKAAANTEPLDANPTDLVALDLTKEPIAVP